MRTFECLENQDVFVQFDVSVMRPANQGFFDIAINFNQIFCSAKFDCCDVDGLEGGDDLACDRPDEDILLLHNGTTRSTTFVLGFACTGGTADDVETHLLMNDITLDCDDDGNADVTIDPDYAGNLPASHIDDASGYLFGAAVFRGEEQLGFNKRYWNLALGVTPEAIADGCVLTTTATADDRNNTDDGVYTGSTLGIDANFVYPLIDWNVSFDSCSEHPVNAGPEVNTTYTTTSHDGVSFSYGFSSAPYLPACTGTIFREAESWDAVTGTPPVLQQYCGPVGLWSGGFHLISSSPGSLVDFNVDIPATGQWDIWAKFAAQGARAVDFYWDDALVADDALDEATGGWCSNNQVWRKVATVDVTTAGTHKLTTSTVAVVYTHLDVMALTNNPDWTPPLSFSSGGGYSAADAAPAIAGTALCP